MGIPGADLANPRLHHFEPCIPAWPDVLLHGSPGFPLCSDYGNDTDPAPMSLGGSIGRKAARTRLQLYAQAVGHYRDSPVATNDRQQVE